MLDDISLVTCARHNGSHNKVPLKYHRYLQYVPLKLNPSFADTLRGPQVSYHTVILIGCLTTLTKDMRRRRRRKRWRESEWFVSIIDIVDGV